MALASDVEQLAAEVVTELHVTFGIYLAVIMRLDDDGVLRPIASAGPLAEQAGRFLLAEQPLARGVTGRVARTGATALIADARLDRDYTVRDPDTDPRSELAVPIRVDGRTWGVLNLEEVAVGAFDETDASLMRTVANQLGVALHRIAHLLRARAGPGDDADRARRRHGGPRRLHRAARGGGGRPGGGDRRRARP